MKLLEKLFLVEVKSNACSLQGFFFDKWVID